MPLAWLAASCCISAVLGPGLQPPPKVVRPLLSFVDASTVGTRYIFRTGGYANLQVTYAGNKFSADFTTDRGVIISITGIGFIQGLNDFDTLRAKVEQLAASPNGMTKFEVLISLFGDGNKGRQALQNFLTTGELPAEITIGR